MTVDNRSPLIVPRVRSRNHRLRDQMKKEMAKEGRPDLAMGAEVQAILARPNATLPNGVLNRHAMSFEEAQKVIRYKALREPVSPTPWDRPEAKVVAEPVGPFKQVQEIGADVLAPISRFADKINAGEKLRNIERTPAAHFAMTGSIPASPASYLVGAVKYQLEFKDKLDEKRRHLGRELSYSETLDLVQDTYRLPPGVAGAAEFLPWLVVPGASSVGLSMKGLKMRALAKATNATTKVDKVKFQSVAKLLQAGQAGIKPIAVVEDGIAELFGVTAGMIRGAAGGAVRGTGKALMNAPSVLEPLQDLGLQLASKGRLRLDTIPAGASLAQRSFSRAKDFLREIDEGSRLLNLIRQKGVAISAKTKKEMSALLPGQSVFRTIRDESGTDIVDPSVIRTIQDHVESMQDSLAQAIDPGLFTQYQAQRTIRDEAFRALEAAPKASRRELGQTAANEQRELDRIMNTIKQADIPPPPPPTTTTGARLPDDLTEASVTFRRREVQFADDTDKALFVVGTRGKKSPRDKEHMKFLRDQFPALSDAQIRSVGMDMRTHVRAVTDVQPKGPVSIQQWSGPAPRIAEDIPRRPTPSSKNIGEETIDPSAEIPTMTGDIRRSTEEVWDYMLDTMHRFPAQKSANARRPLENAEDLYTMGSLDQSASLLSQPGKFLNLFRVPPGAPRNFTSLAGIKGRILATGGYLAERFSPVLMNRENPIAWIGYKLDVFKENEMSRATAAVAKYWVDVTRHLDFQEIKGVWRATKVKPANKGIDTNAQNYGTIDDLIEHPERYMPFTDAQQKVLRIGSDMQTSILRQTQDLGVDAKELSEMYWNRIVLKRPGEAVEKLQAHMRRSKSWTHHRAFKDIDEATALGFKYDTNPRTRLVSRLHAGIEAAGDAMAKKQLQELRDASGELLVRQVTPRLVGEAIPGARTALRRARTIVENARQAIETQGVSPERHQVLRSAMAQQARAWHRLKTLERERGRMELDSGEVKLSIGIVPEALEQEIRNRVRLGEFSKSRGMWDDEVNTTNEAFRMLRATKTNLDIGAGFIQGQTLFFRNNVAWWKAQYYAVNSLVKNLDNYTAQHYEIIDEGIRAGAISPPTEYLFAQRGFGTLPLRIPILGKAMRAFNRSFESFIFVGQTELYKAGRMRVLGRDVTKPNIETNWDDLVSLGSAIRKQMGTESYAILGVRPKQQIVESLAFFAARFMRSNIGLLSQAFLSPTLRSSKGANEARMAVGSLLAGATALTIGASYALNGKLPNIDKPEEPDWMQFTVGKTYYNFYGPFYTLFRAQARITDHMLRGEYFSAFDEARHYLESKRSILLKVKTPAEELLTRGVTYDYGDRLAWRDPDSGDITAGSLWGVTYGAAERLAVPITFEEIREGFLEGRPESLMDFFGIAGREDYQQQAREAEGSPRPISIKRPRTSTGGTGGTGPLGIIGTPPPQTERVRRATRRRQPN